MRIHDYSIFMDHGTRTLQNARRRFPRTRSLFIVLMVLEYQLAMSEQMDRLLWLWHVLFNLINQSF